MINILLGLFCIGISIYTIYAFLKSANSSAKVKSMENLFGHRLGRIIYLFSYSFLPLAIGICVLLLHFVWNVEVF